MLLTPYVRPARTHTLLVLATAAVAFSPVVRAQAPGASGARLATIGLSEEFVLHSQITGKDYLIQVAKPLIPSAADAKAPVVYVTDGFTMLSLTSAPARLLPLEGLADAAYVVAIGYEADAFLALGALRQHDLVHVVVENDGRPFGGGGAAFEAFLNDELRPAIEARYPVNHERSVLGGHSLGGLFAATVLANDPHSFAGYIIGSPSLQFDPKLTNALREAAPKGDGRPVFIASGEREADFGMTQFTEEIETALNGTGSRFDVRRMIFADETHVSVTGPTMSHGLRHVLSPTVSSSATLSPPSSTK